MNHSTVSAKPSPPSVMGRIAYTIPHGPRMTPIPKQLPPPSTHYTPNYGAVRSHSSMASIGCGRKPDRVEERPPPGHYNIQSPALKPLYLSSLTREKGSFLETRSAAPNVSYAVVDGYAPKGGKIQNTLPRFPKEAVSVTPCPGSYDFSTTAIRNTKGTVFSRSLATRPRPRVTYDASNGTLDHKSGGPAFARASTYGTMSYCAASKISRLIDSMEDELDQVDDKAVRSDLEFLKGVREDIVRWKIKSALES